MRHQGPIAAICAVDSATVRLVPFPGMDDPTPSSQASDARHALDAAVAASWHAFFQRFRPDEHDFERVSYLEDAAPFEEPMRALQAGKPASDAFLVQVVTLLEQFAQRRFEEQNQRMTELMDLCEQMRQRLEAAELSRAQLEDEFRHCHAIVAEAMQRHQLSPPAGLSHAPRLHNLFNHLLAHLAPGQGSLDTKRFQRLPEAKRPEEPTDPYDYDRLRKLFRKT